MRGWRGENARLAGRVAELQAQRQRGQKRSAAPFSKNQPKANPKRPGRKKGEGKFEFRRAPMPTVCPACGAAAELLQPVAFELPTITELPQPKPRVTQYRCYGVLPTRADPRAQQAGVAACGAILISCGEELTELGRVFGSPVFFAAGAGVADGFFCGDAAKFDAPPFEQN